MTNIIFCSADAIYTPELNRLGGVIIGRVLHLIIEHAVTTCIMSLPAHTLLVLSQLCVTYTSLNIYTSMLCIGFDFIKGVWC